MSAEAILADLIECGIEPSVTPDKTGIVVPAGRLTDDQRAAVLGHKPELIACILESARVTSELLEAAMRAAAHWNDNPEDWRQQCMEVPPHHRQDLLDHLQRQYPKP
ncbi:MAG: hypothetical protein JSR69_17730 [Proteobacteria bacterium]|nr:hypothetical protein [Pseudomonadota bacterium]